MTDRPRQSELPLTRDDREAHRLYLESPPAKAREPRPPGYFEGLMVELRLSAYPAKRSEVAMNLSGVPES